MTSSAATTAAEPHQHQQSASRLTERRCSGVLLHLTCLPSAHGIGDLGVLAREFADRLSAAGQRYWQILPLTPSIPENGESPYFSNSAFAGNPLLIDLEALAGTGLLDAADLQVHAHFPDREVDFEQVRRFKLSRLDLAQQRFLARGGDAAYDAFCNREAFWLEDYALFAALKAAREGQSWARWPAALRDRDPAALAAARKEHAVAIRRHKVWQFFFSSQWEALKRYCNERGLLIFGDMPIYVSYESADVWANPDIFKLGAERRPTAVSGVPPDYFSATGQLWNNPVYNWTRLRETQFAWWRARMAALFQRFDTLRIDHFRGLVQYWEVPAGADTAIHGRWEDVPAYELFDALRGDHPQFPVVVEDLGTITPDVVAVKNHYGLPGMLVLQFAFGEDGDHNPYLPCNHHRDALVYLGTHDNTTSMDWLQHLDGPARARLRQQLPSQGGEPGIRELLELVLGSPAGIAIVTAQDLLALPARARMNDPQFSAGNWRWRLTEAEFARIPWDSLSQLTESSGRRWTR